MAHAMSTSRGYAHAHNLSLLLLLLLLLHFTHSVDVMPDSLDFRSFAAIQLGVDLEEYFKSTVTYGVDPTWPIDTLNQFSIINDLIHYQGRSLLSWEV